jgi:hypothetical protein
MGVVVWRGVRIDGHAANRIARLIGGVIVAHVAVSGVKTMAGFGVRHDVESVALFQIPYGGI